MDIKLMKKTYIIIFFLFISIVVSFYSDMRNKNYEKGFAERVMTNFKRTKFFGVKLIKPVKIKNKRKSDSDFFEDPKESMNSFFEKLKLSEEDKLNNTVKILFWATSSNGFDRVTSRMRYRLQPLFGDGGKGYITATKSGRFHRHQDIEWSMSDTWKSFSLLNNQRHKHEESIYGLGGVLSINTDNAWISYSTINPGPKYTPGTRFSKMLMFYRQYHEGGTIKIKVDDLNFTVNSKNKKSKDKVFKIEVEDKPHRVLIKTDKKPSKIYGFAFDRDKGLIIDSLMYPATYIHHLNYFNKEHISGMVLSRKPDLLIFNFGARDINDDSFSSNYKKIEETTPEYIKAVNTIKSKVPGTSCLIISIKDFGKDIGSKIITRPGVEKMVEENRKVAFKTGCAYFNMFKAMGGKGSMERWRLSKLVSKDLGHLFNSGSKKVGDIISDLIIKEYERYRQE